MPDNRLRDKSAEAWLALVEYYRNFPDKDVVRDQGGKPHYDWTKHEGKLSACIDTVLSDILDRLRKREDGLSIGCGIVHVNSPLARRRIKLPVWGHSSSTHSSVWKKLVAKGNSRSLMFRQPGSAKHLLTELMWRLQQSSEIGKGSALALFLTDADPLYHPMRNAGVALACCSKGIDFFQNRNNNWRKGKLNGKSAFSLLQLNNLTLKTRFWNPLNKKLKSVGDNAAVRLEGFAYSGKMGNDLTKNLISPAIDALFKMGKVPFNNKDVPTNIFYLPDVLETDEVGGIDFQVIYSGTTHPSAEVLRAFLSDVQWLISQYVIHPLVAAERNLALAGEAYKKTYFCTTNNRSRDGLDQIIECLESAKDNTNIPAPASNVLDIVIRHFSVARSTVGDYWRGYPRLALETAHTVGAIFDELFQAGKRNNSPVALVNIADVAMSCGSGLEGLREAKLPGILRQLFRGLAAENELFLTPSYREHFVHSFHCFVLGLILLNWKSGTVLPGKLIQRFHAKNQSRKLLREWFLVSMWHDVAYSLQKGHELLEGFVTDFMDARKRGKRCRGLIPWNPQLGHLFQAKEMLDPLRAVARKAFYVSKELTRLGIGADDLALASALDRADHGIWSALFFGHVCNQKWLHQYKIDREVVMRAILVHHLPDWGLKSVLSDFELDEALLKEMSLARSKLQEDANKGLAVFVCQHRNPLGVLLFLADMLSQQGREAPEIGGRVPSRIGIHLAGLQYIGSKKKALVVRMKYDSFPFPIHELRDKFFGNPAKFFKINYTTRKRTRAGMLCIQLQEGDVPDNSWIRLGGDLTEGRTQ